MSKAKRGTRAGMAGSPHFWWLIGILAAVIIGMAAYIILGLRTEERRVIEYISLCSVILSITLSVFAIQYTYTSNIDTRRQFDRINASSEGIMEASRKLSGTSEHLDTKIDMLLGRLDSIDQSQQSMTSKIEDINNKVSIDTKNFTTPAPSSQMG